MDQNYFPLDYDSLKKGDVIPPETIEDFAGVKRGTDKFNLAMLGLMERVYRELRARGKYYTLAVRKGQLCVLTDEQAAEHNARRIRAGFRHSRRSYRRLAKVDVGVLSDNQKKDHERNLIVFGKMLQAAKSARQKVLAVAHERSVPGLPQPVG